MVQPVNELLVFSQKKKKEMLVEEAKCWKTLSFFLWHLTLCHFRDWLNPVLLFLYILYEISCIQHPKISSIKSYLVV